MLKTIKNTAPFIMLGYCLIISILSHFEVYHSIFNYAGDILGYSLFTNLFMWSIYMNKKYCTATKIAVIALSVLNLLSIAYIYYGINGTDLAYFFDFCLYGLTALTLIVFKFIK